MAIKYLDAKRLQGTNAERLAMSGGVDKGIKAYYQFEDATSGTLTNVATGSDYPDGTGDTNDSTSIGGGVSRVTGKVGLYAYDFDASTTGIVSVGSSIFSGTGDYSVAVWLYHDVEDVNDTIVRAASQSLGQYQGATDKYIFGSLSSVATSSTIPTNTWGHVVYTRSGTTQTIYFNGSSENSSTNSTNIATGTWTIGGRNTLVEMWHGKIDELIIANRAFTASEVSSIYNGGTGGTLASMPLVTIELPNGTIFNETDTYKYFMWDGTDTWNQMVSS